MVEFKLDIRCVEEFYSHLGFVTPDLELLDDLRDDVDLRGDVDVPPHAGLVPLVHDALLEGDGEADHGDVPKPVDDHSLGPSLDHNILLRPVEGGAEIPSEDLDSDGVVRPLLEAKAISGGEDEGLQAELG